MDKLKATSSKNKFIILLFYYFILLYSKELRATGTFKVKFGIVTY